MICYLNFLLLLTFITDNLWVDSLASPVPNSDCPLVDDVHHAVMLPYAQDCSKYFSCLKGMAYLQQCPNNLHWNTLTYRCDYPDKAKCQTNTISPASANALPASLTGEIMYHLYPHDCSQYYKCRALACPTNYYWNFRTQKCDFPHNAQCPFVKERNNLKDFNSLSALPEQSSLQSQSYRGNTFTLQYPNDCGKFYECQAMLCPATYHWNSRLQQCDLPQIAQCARQSEITEILDTTTNPVPTAFTAPPTGPATAQINGNASAECLDCVQRCDGYLHHYLPHPFDCHKFIQCNGWSFIHTCPDNLFWNARLNTCDRVCVAI